MSMMTEDEAKTKWCHQSRWSAGDIGHSGWNNTADRMNRCQGSECMAWRWASASLLPTPDGNMGYCGLAGRPT